MAIFIEKTNKSCSPYKNMNLVNKEIEIWSYKEEHMDMLLKPINIKASTE